jgi:hypothetical protein
MIISNNEANHVYSVGTPDLDHPLTSPGPACGSRAEQVGSFWKEKFAEKFLGPSGEGEYAKPLGRSSLVHACRERRTWTGAQSPSFELM